MLKTIVVEISSRISLATVTISVDSDEDSEDPETEFAGEIDSSDHRISFKQQKILSLCDYDSSADDMDG